MQRLHDRPRRGLVSGCFPLVVYYKGLPKRQELVVIKQQLGKASLVVLTVAVSATYLFIRQQVAVGGALHI